MSMAALPLRRSLHGSGNLFFFTVEARCGGGSLFLFTVAERRGSG
jgi:hypothetical protein